MTAEESRASDHFAKELDRLIDRFRAEYDMTYSEVVGCLAMRAVDMAIEARDGLNDEEETP